MVRNPPGSIGPAIWFKEAVDLNLDVLEEVVAMAREQMA